MMPVPLDIKKYILMHKEETTDTQLSSCTTTCTCVHLIYAQSHSKNYIKHIGFVYGQTDGWNIHGYLCTHTHRNHDSFFPQINEATEGTDTISIQWKSSPYFKWGLDQIRLNYVSRTYLIDTYVQTSFQNNYWTAKNVWNPSPA